MITQKILRMHEEKCIFSLKNPICGCSRSNQMPITDQITEIAPYVRTYFCVTNIGTMQRNDRLLVLLARTFVWYKRIRQTFLGQPVRIKIVQTKREIY